VFALRRRLRCISIEAVREASAFPSIYNLRVIRVFGIFLFVSTCALADLATVASTFGAGQSFSAGIGWGTVNPARLAYPFIPSQDVALYSVSLGVSAGVGPDRSMTVSIASDLNGIPGTILETMSASNPLASFPDDTGPTTVYSVAQPLLKAGSVYWVSATGGSPGDGINWLTANILSNPDLQGIYLQSTGWTASPLLYGYNNPGAYSVTGIKLSPMPNSPGAGATVGSSTAIFSWDPSPHATSYNIYLGISFPLQLVGTTSGTAFTSPTLQPYQSYFWQIGANNGVGTSLSQPAAFFTSGALSTGPITATTALPSSGSALTQNFTFSFGDPFGAPDLSVLDVLINDYLDGQSACYFAFVPATSTTGFLYLVDDLGDGGYAAGSPLYLPSTGLVHNNQCSIDGAQSSIAASGNNLAVSAAVTFASAFAGNKVIYSAARSSSENSGWQAVGTWTLPGTSIVGPSVGGVSPARAVTSSGTFSFTFSDSNGWQNLAVLDVLTNSAIDGIGACYFAYVPSSAIDGSLYLVDDAGDGGYVGPPIQLSSGGSLHNSQCTINTVGSSASASGNSLTLNLAMSFSGSFAGNRIFYLAARDSGTGNSGWKAGGTLMVQ
jgi:hypothetical protein